MFNNKVRKIFLMLIASLVFYSSGALAGTKLLKTYYTPASAGIVWVTVNPSYVGWRSYKADFTIDFGRSKKRFVVTKSSGYPVTVGIPHWNNNGKTVMVSKEIWHWRTNNTSVVRIRQGSRPNYRYQTIKYWKR